MTVLLVVLLVVLAVAAVVAVVVALMKLLACLVVFAVGAVLAGALWRKLTGGGRSSERVRATAPQQHVGTGR